MKRKILVFTVTLGVFAQTLLVLAAVRPPLGWTVPCEVLYVHDGDTVIVTVKKTIHVRLLDCWAPELSQPDGKASRDHLEAMLHGKNAYLHIPGNELISKSFTFSRVLGRIYAEDVDTSEQMVADGFATKTKVATK